MVVLLHDANFSLELTNLTSETVHVRVVSRLELIDLPSVALSCFNLSLLES